MTMQDERIYIGGMLRCCIATLQEKLASQKEPSKEEDTIKCKHCSSWMVFQIGAWRWDMDSLRDGE